MSVPILSIANSVMLVSKKDVLITALHHVRSLEIDGGWSHVVGASVRTVVGACEVSGALDAGARVIATLQRHSAKPLHCLQVLRLVFIMRPW